MAYSEAELLRAGFTREAINVAGRLARGLETFDKALAMKNAIAQKRGSPTKDIGSNADRYRALVMAFASTLTPDKSTSAKAVALFLSDYPDAESEYRRMMAISRDQRYYGWMALCRDCLLMMKNSEDIGPMLTLVEGF